jgi:AcrR family transcriptional regulator
VPPSTLETTEQQVLDSVYQSYASFERGFEYKGERLYSLIFERNKDKIKVSKEKFAVKNLQKIFSATFHITPKIGFQAMSLRDLSAETGLSMGGLYSSISNKEAIAVIVKDVVALICAEIVEESQDHKEPLIALQNLVRGYLYASTLMQPWFYFLYFETRSLPQSEQEESKNIELTQVKAIKALINELRPASAACHQSDFVATMALSLIQERYLKPWKYHNAPETIDEYADNCLQLIYRAICVEEQQPCSAQRQID